MHAGREPDEMIERLRVHVACWASSAIGLPAVGTETLDSLVDELQKSGRTILFLMDEVQRFFEVKEGTIHPRVGCSEGLHVRQP